MTQVFDEIHSPNLCARMVKADRAVEQTGVHPQPRTSEGELTE